MAPDAGSVTIGASVKLGYFAQQALELLDPDLTIEEQLQKDFPHESIGVLRSLAGAFQFSGDDIDKKIRSLSGGEKSRLAMARMLFDPPNFLVLDEPTNHLDMPAIEQLEIALEAFRGTVLLVTHDRALLRNVRLSRVIELADGRVDAQALSGAAKEGAKQLPPTRAASRPKSGPQGGSQGSLF